MFPLLQIFLLIFTTLLLNMGITNPNPTNNTDYIPHQDISAILKLKFLPKIGKSVIWIGTLYQILYLYLQVFSPSLIPVAYPYLSTFIDPLPWTPASVLGYILMIVGGLGRVWCYKTLGVFFTYEITIRHSHKLIRTGPYAYLRHPSYTFLFILVVGVSLVHHRLTNFFSNNYWVQNLFGPVAVLINGIILILAIKRRVIREEEELEKKFGKEWIQHASRTKRFVPGLI